MIIAHNPQKVFLECGSPHNTKLAICLFGGFFWLLKHFCVGRLRLSQSGPSEPVVRVYYKRNELLSV